MARSLALSIRNVIETFAISFPTVVDASRDRIDMDECNRRLDSWSSRVVHNLDIDLDVSGRENQDPTRIYVIMSNHQSHYDIPVLYHVLGGNIRMVAKKELFRVPVFGRAMEAAGFISVDRSNRTRAVASLNKAKEVLARGLSVFIAPEGTRSKTGELLPFKKGGFNLAIDMGLPILPVSIDGTRHALPPSAARSTSGVKVRVRILPAIDTAIYAARGRDGRDALLADVRSQIAASVALSEAEAR
ncbi:lysophospholipid acyltransferase family protein [soil metagenome]